MDDILLNILKLHNYINPSRYISGRIIEYDIKSANVSILYSDGIIDQNTYNKLISLPKQEREKEIGIMIRNNPNIYDAIREGFEKYRILLGENNNFDSNQIVRISNDAVYINTSYDLQNTVFDNIVVFRQKSEYNVFINLMKNILIFVGFINNGINIDVKGISEFNIPLHTQYMLNIIGTTVYYIERSSIDDALRYLSGIIEDYINRRLPIGYYREFNSDSNFKLSINETRYSVSESISDDYIQYIDINYNLFILRELWSILLELYNRRKS